MDIHTPRTVWKWMAATVLVHLLVSMIHGAAHAGANVPMSPAANIFVFVVILAGPLNGLGILAELPPPPPPPGMPNPWSEPFVTVFTVLPEQLGLKLDSRRGPVDVLVIDRAEQPTEN